MIVYVEGGYNKQKELVYNVIEHCYKQLLNGHDINIFLKLKPTLKDSLNGWCQHNYSNNFDIAINNTQSKTQLIKTICHEMVHVKQGIKNELTYKNNNKYCRLWKGIEYTNECPWEVEAYQLEDKLFNAYMEQCNEKK